MAEASLVAALTERPSQRGKELEAFSGAVKYLEVRADVVGDLDADWLRNHFRGQILYSLRSRADGGEFAGPDEQRRQRLQQAARRYDLVELEADRDLHPAQLTQIPPRQRLVSWHGPAGGVDELRAKFGQMATIEASLYKLVATAANVGEALAPLLVLQAVGRQDTTAFAAGPFGVWTRLLAPRLGAPIVFGKIAGGSTDADEPEIARLVADYGLPALHPASQLFGIVGGRVNHSLSPRLHNAAYRALGMPALYVPFSVPSFGEFWERLAGGGAPADWGMPLSGFSLAAPHKEAALAAANRGSVLAQRAGAANVVARSSDGWEADSADADGVLRPLMARGIDVTSRRAAVVGCGGAGRAVAAALDEQGAIVTVVNRTEDRGQTAADRLGLPFVPLSRFRPEAYDIVVNATPVGRDDDLPFSVERLDGAAVVIDFAYSSRPTPLVNLVRRRGGVAIEGREVLFHQARRQFQVMTGAEMPADLVERLLGLDA
jgi:3-dehydroquinate dehydratase / shikimate dehydrogenase